MADEKKRWLPGRPIGHTPTTHVRMLTAAATRMDVGSRAEARLQRSLRQNWQIAAWIYSDSIPEMRFAREFVANATSRMRIYPAVLPVGGESDIPISLEEAGAPPEWIAACNQMIRDLGNGRMAMSTILKSPSANMQVAGECFLLGREDPYTASQNWSIRSIDEIVIYDDQIMLREGPINSRGDLGLVELDPSTTFVSRMWNPHPRYRILADSPMRALINDAEALMILRRMIRATGRSRLAGRGLLLMPQEMTLVRPNNDDEDDANVDFLGEFIDGIITPISEEGNASAVVPGILQGPAEYLKEVRHIDFAASFDEMSIKNRAELVQTIAIGMDLPKEIITGMSDAARWTAVQVSDDTFRHHIEPHVIMCVDSLTGAFARPYLESCGLDPALLSEWLRRTVLWYDPTELVTKPDRTGAAKDAHTALVISDKSYRDTIGFTDEDAPTAAEIEIRMIRTTRTYPPNLLMGLMHLLDPELTVSPITTSGTIPGIGPSGLIEPPPPPMAGEQPAAPTVTPTDEQSPVDKPAAIVASATPEQRELLSSLVKAALVDMGMVLVRKDESAENQELAGVEVTLTPPIALAAAGKVSHKAKPSAKSLKLSRRLAQIDQELQVRLTVAANDAMLRKLEKAGTRLATKVSKNEVLRTKIAMTRREYVGAMLGKDAIEKTGLTASGLLTTDWDSFKESFYSWTETAQRQAIAAAETLSGTKSSVAISAAMASNRDSAWAMLEHSLNALAEGLLYNPNPNMDANKIIDSLSPDALVPTGVLRAAVGVSGGAVPQDYGLIKTNAGVEVPAVPLGITTGGIGTGGTISGFLQDAGAQTSQYEWIHGPSVRVFEPHENLDGVEFSSFTDDVLANTGDFPSNQFFLPGDHVGCLCTAAPMWISADDVQAARDFADANSL